MFDLVLDSTDQNLARLAEKRKAGNSRDAHLASVPVVAAEMTGVCMCVCVCVCMYVRMCADIFCVLCRVVVDSTDQNLARLAEKRKTGPSRDSHLASVPVVAAEITGVCVCMYVCADVCGCLCECM